MPKSKGLLQDAICKSFVDCLKSDEIGSVSFKRLAAHNQNISLETCKKKVISSYCDKRKYANCGIHTVSHYPNSVKNIDCPYPFECNFLKKYFILKYP